MKKYFSGWYVKCQSDHAKCAFIFAFHEYQGEKSCSIQIITEDNAWNIDLPYSTYRQSQKPFYIKIGNNLLTDQEMIMDLKTPALSVSGTISFSDFHPLKYDVMGPFQYVPFMQCKHCIKSMKHKVNGTIMMNDKAYIFKDNLGYIEGDQGFSFPKQYIWTQCFFEDNSLMLSVADIPFGLFHFTGIIGVIIYNQQEYRFATYLNAKVIKNDQQEVIIQQNDMLFKAKLIKNKGMPLLAPDKGKMSRTIHESIACHACYTLIKDQQTIFSFETENASFEYEYH